jgi:hypothetical protein
MRKKDPAPDPEHFGRQLDNTYMPGPEEIVQQCEELQRLWSPREIRKRAGWAQSTRCTMPEVGMSDMRRSKSFEAR